MIKFLKFKNKGFTLVETLVALSIFSMSLITLLSVLLTGTSQTNYAKEKMIAGYLSQEGIEYVRNMRDTSMLYSSSPQTGWANFVAKLSDGSCFESDGCYIEDDEVFEGGDMPIINLANVNPCSGACPAFFYDSLTGKYNYVSDTPSDFSRKIQVTQVSLDEVKVSSTVSWVQVSGTRSMTLSENLFNWIE